MKKYTMDDFINNKIAVKVSGDNLKALLKVCEKHGLKWRFHEKPTSFFPSDCKVLVCKYEDHETNVLSCFSAYNKSDKKKLKDHGFNVVPFSALVLEKEKRYQIFIDCDGDITTAKMIVNGKEVKTAKAKRNPDDKFNWRLAAQLAFDRLFGKKAEKPKKQPKKQPGVFEVGDRVVCVEQQQGNKYVIGKHGRVVFGATNHLIAVEFDKPVHGHDCFGKAKDGYGYYIARSKLRHE